MDTSPSLVRGATTADADAKVDIKIARGQYKLDSRVNHQPLRCHSWHIALRARAKCRTARVPSAISALGGALSGQDLCSGSCYAFPVNLFHWNARHATNAAADAVRESVR
jgi:hypothetical protein